MAYAQVFAMQSASDLPPVILDVWTTYAASAFCAAV